MKPNPHCFDVEFFVNVMNQTVFKRGEQITLDYRVSATIRTAVAAAAAYFRVRCGRDTSG